MPTTKSGPPRVANAPAALPSRRDLKRYSGLVSCAGCRTTLTLLPREGLELAWSEDTICSVRRHQALTIYFCRGCGEVLLHDGPVAVSDITPNRPAMVDLSR